MLVWSGIKKSVFPCCWNAWMRHVLFVSNFLLLKSQNLYKILIILLLYFPLASCINVLYQAWLYLTLFRMGWGNFTPPAAFFLLWKIEVGLWPATIFQRTKFIFTCFLKIWAHFDPLIKSSQSFVSASWHVIFGWINTRKIWL